MQEVAEIEFDNTKFAAILDGTVAENARKLGVSRQHLNNIIKGRRFPSRSLMFKIQTVFEIDLEKILKKN